MSELVEYFAHHYALAIDNTEWTYKEARRVARDAILEETPGITRDQYRAMSDEERTTAYAYAIGAGVLALIGEWTDEVLDEHAGSMGAQLLSEVRIIDGADLAYALGEGYVPEPDDVDFLDEADDDE